MTSVRCKLRADKYTFFIYVWQKIKSFFAVNFKIFSNIYKLFSLWGLHIEILNNHNGILQSLIRQGALTSKNLYFFVELEPVVTGLRTEHTATTYKHRRVDVATTGSAATLLPTELTGRTRNLASLLRLGSALALVSQILLHVQVKHMVIRLNSEDTFCST